MYRIIHSRCKHYILPNWAVVSPEHVESDLILVVGVLMVAVRGLGPILLEGVIELLIARLVMMMRGRRALLTHGLLAAARDRHVGR